MDTNRIRAKNLQALIDSLAGGSQAAFSRLIEKSSAQINQWLIGNRNMNSDTARRLEKKLALPFGYMDDKASVGTGDTLIPQYDACGSMGNGLLLRDQSGAIRNINVSADWLRNNVKHCTAIENLCVVTGFGDSMRPMFNSGDPLLLDSGVKDLEGDAVYFFRVGDEGFIKRLQRIPGDGIRAISENKGYESWTIRPDMDFEIFGRIIKVWCSEDF